MVFRLPSPSTPLLTHKKEFKKGNIVEYQSGAQKRALRLEWKHSVYNVPLKFILLIVEALALNYNRKKVKRLFLEGADDTVKVFPDSSSTVLSKATTNMSFMKLLLSQIPNVNVERFTEEDPQYKLLLPVSWDRAAETAQCWHSASLSPCSVFIWFETPAYERVLPTLKAALPPSVKSLHKCLHRQAQR